MKYYLLKCRVESRDLNEENYGILTVSDDNSREYICDVTEDADSLSSLVENMNEYNIELYHAREIVEDFKFNKNVKRHI